MLQLIYVSLPPLMSAYWAREMLSPYLPEQVPVLHAVLLGRVRSRLPLLLLLIRDLEAVLLAHGIAELRSRYQCAGRTHVWE